MRREASVYSPQSSQRAQRGCGGSSFQNYKIAFLRIPSVYSVSSAAKVSRCMQSVGARRRAVQIQPRALPGEHGGSERIAAAKAAAIRTCDGAAAFAAAWMHDLAFPGQSPGLDLDGAPSRALCSSFVNRGPARHRSGLW